MTYGSELPDMRSSLYIEGLLPIRRLRLIVRGIPKKKSTCVDYSDVETYILRLEWRQEHQQRLQPT